MSAIAEENEYPKLDRSKMTPYMLFGNLKVSYIHYIWSGLYAKN